MPIEISATVYFTLDGAGIPQATWYQAKFLGQDLLGPARQPANRVQITGRTNMQTGFRIGEKILLNKSVILVRSKDNLDSCVNPETQEWVRNIGNECYWLAVFNRINNRINK